MGNPPDQQQTKGLIKDGLRQLRAGKVSAAIKIWEEVLTLDASNVSAQSYIEYIKQNRIRIAVHLGRTPPRDDEPIDVPESWPEPPPGLSDPVTGPDVDEVQSKDATTAEADKPSAQLRPATRSSGELPYAEVELTGASRPRLSDVLAKGQKATPAKPNKTASQKAPKAPPAPRPPADKKSKPGQSRRPAPTSAPTADDYLALEIMVEDGDAPADPKTLPPPPGSADAPPEMIIEAPKQESAEDQQEDYLYDRGSSDQLESLSLDHLTGAGKTGGKPSTPSSAPSETPGAGSVDHPLTPRVATTFDEVATNPRGDPNAFSHPALGKAGDPSPYTTLVGLGPRVLFAEPGDKDLQGTAPPLEFAPPTVEDQTAGAPISTTPDDYEREQGSFSEDAPTRALDTRAKAPQVHMGAPADYDREEGSFSDDLPTHARPSMVQAGPGVIAEPGDFDSEEGSFSDDLPTRSRSMPGSPEAGIRAMPLDADFRREGSFSDDLATLERDSSQQEEQLSEEMEALLHPERGLALAAKLHNTGEHNRSLKLAEQLHERYPRLEGVAELLAANHTALEASLLEQLGDLDSIPIPKTEDLGHDNRELDPRAAFLFSRIDGTLSLQDIMDISGMTPFEAARLLLRLREIGLLEFEPPR